MRKVIINPTNKNSNSGFCQCGVCECQSGFSGKHCQCSDVGCPGTKHGICGGNFDQYI